MCTFIFQGQWDWSGVMTDLERANQVKAIFLTEKWLVFLFYANLRHNNSSFRSFINISHLMDSTEVAVLDCKFILLAHNFIGVTYILIPSICFPFGRNPSFPCTFSSSEPQRLNLNGYQIFYVMQYKESLAFLWVLCISGIKKSISSLSFTDLICWGKLICSNILFYIIILIYLFLTYFLLTYSKLPFFLNVSVCKHCKISFTVKMIN